MIDDCAVHEAEDPAVQFQRMVGGDPQGAVERRKQHSAPQPFPAGSALCDHDLQALAPARHQLRDEFRGILQVRIEHDHALPL